MRFYPTQQRTLRALVSCDIDDKAESLKFHAPEHFVIVIDASIDAILTPPISTLIIFKLRELIGERVAVSHAACYLVLSAPSVFSRLLRAPRWKERIGSTITRILGRRPGASRAEGRPRASRDYPRADRFLHPWPKRRTYDRNALNAPLTRTRVPRRCRPRERMLHRSGKSVTWLRGIAARDSILARAGLKAIAQRSSEPPHWVINAANHAVMNRLYLAGSLKAAAIRECKFIPRCV